MSVELIPNEPGHNLGLANGTWFALLKGPLKAILPDAPRTNDPIRVSLADSLRCAEALRGWEPPPDWNGGDHARLLDWLDDFFRRCGGFETA